MQPADPSLLPPSLARFLDLWNAKRGPRRMPARRDFSHEEPWPWMGLLNLVAVEGEEARFVAFCETSARGSGGRAPGPCAGAWQRGMAWPQSASTLPAPIW